MIVLYYILDVLIYILDVFVLDFLIKWSNKFYSIRIWLYMYLYVSGLVYFCVWSGWILCVCDILFDILYCVWLDYICVWIGWNMYTDLYCVCLKTLKLILKILIVYTTSILNWRRISGMCSFHISSVKNRHGMYTSAKDRRGRSTFHISSAKNWRGKFVSYTPIKKYIFL